MGNRVPDPDRNSDEPDPNGSGRVESDISWRRVFRTGFESRVDFGFFRVDIRNSLRNPNLNLLILLELTYPVHLVYHNYRLAQLQCESGTYLFERKKKLVNLVNCDIAASNLPTL